MTRDQMIEAVARAICKAEGVAPDKDDFGNTAVANWRVFDDMAETALSALEAAGLRIVPRQPMTDKQKCETCMGHGVVYNVNYPEPVGPRPIVPCPTCHGTGSAL